MQAASKERRIVNTCDCLPQPLITESVVTIMLHFQLYSSHYTALQTNSMRGASAINPVTMENADDDSHDI